MDEKKSLDCKVVSLRTLIDKLIDIIKEELPDVTWDKIREEVSARFIGAVDSSFLCEQNSDIISFLKDDALINEYRHLSRTFIVMDSSEKNWLGMFTLGQKVIDISNLSNSQRKKYLAREKKVKEIKTAPSILLGQFAKNDHCSEYKQNFCGDILMKICLSFIEDARKLIGCKLVFLDSVNCDGVINFYESYGFKKFGDVFINQKEEQYQPMMLSYEEDNYK
ncbi:hypothetical protein BCR22_06430 [Enterococcus plantarum]|uniref:hypothetical protein n=1 Tax=Enterococcus plantarum TaxID=1077675 RepID=UPI00084D34F5|nr:hypothetical protein [Enterococcus plantarum]MBO0423520.1 hypothetical protein [Enterococcus plantarum]OEG10086.1 hypothetical protein BCR22_06430 [Enterococcus plantarum]